jgi:hypothetical protein
LRGIKKESRLTSKVRKSAKKIFTAYAERWFLRKIENNPKLGATKLAAEIENRLHKKG